MQRAAVLKVKSEVTQEGRNSVSRLPLDSKTTLTGMSNLPADPADFELANPHHCMN